MPTSKFVSLDRLAYFWEKLKAYFVHDPDYVHTDNNFTTAEKDKLSGIAEGANNYELPTASASVLGGVKVGGGLTINADGILSATGGGTADAVDWENVIGRPTKLSEFTNDEGFIDNTVNNLTNYYLKTETYTQTEVDALIGAIKTIQIEVVDTLPTTGATNIIYLVANTGSGTNSYDEYVWVESQKKFEKIGTTDIDLTQYWAKTELTECTNADIDALFTTSN